MNRRDVLAAAFAAAAGAAAAAAPVRAALAASGDDTVLRLSAVKDRPIVVAFVIGEGANVLDTAGSWEVFQDTMVDGWNEMPFSLYTVADSRAPLKATGGFQIVPTYAFSDSHVPQPNVIVMGAQGQHTPQKIGWIREMSANADVAMSVCTGAFLLAQTGMLDGRLATTHHDYYVSFAKKFPDVRLVRDVRYVENPGGKLCSAGGISSGIELALRVVDRYFGDAATAQTAYYMEYNRSSTRPAAS